MSISGGHHSYIKMRLLVVISTGCTVKSQIYHFVLLYNFVYYIMNAVQVVPVLCSHPYMNEQLFLQMAAMKD